MRKTKRLLEKNSLGLHVGGMGVIKKIYLLRHGETAWTKSGQHTSFTDIELTPNGRWEAKRLGKTIKHIKFDYVFSSPVKRARETFKLAGFKEAEVKIDPRLLEWNYGDYEGLTTKEIHKTNPGWTIFTQDPPSGETAKEIEKRVDDLLKCASSLDGLVAFVSSAHVTRVIGARWLKMPVSFGQHLLLSTGAKSILGYEHASPVLCTWNDTSHLE